MGDIYDIMVKDLMARRQAEEEEDTDDDEEDEDDEISSQSGSEGEPVALDEAEREMLRRTLSMDADGEYDDDDNDRSPYAASGGMEENGKARTEPHQTGGSEEEEEEMPKAKEVSAVLSMKPQQYTIDRRWASASTLPSLPMRDQGPAGCQKQSKQQKEEGGGSPKSGRNSSNNGSPSGSGSHFLSLRNLRSKDKEAKESKTSKDGHQKRRSKEEAPSPSPSSSSATSSSSSSSSIGGKVRKRDILRGTFLSLREEKQELRGKLHEWRAQRDSEKKEKEVDRELRKRTKEEAKAAKHEPSSSSSSSSSSKRTTRKQEEEWERKDRKAAEAYAKRYGLDCSFDDRPREGTKCYTSFDDNEVEDDAPLAPRPLLGARP